MKYPINFEHLLEMLWGKTFAGWWLLQWPSSVSTNLFVSRLEEAVSAAQHAFPWLEIRTIEFVMVEAWEEPHPWWEPNHGDLRSWLQTISVLDAQVDHVLVQFDVLLTLIQEDGQAQDHIFEKMGFLTFNLDIPHTLAAELLISPDFFADWYSLILVHPGNDKPTEADALLVRMLAENRKELREGLRKWELASKGKIVSFGSQSNPYRVFEYGFQDV